MEKYLSTIEMIGSTMAVVSGLLGILAFFGIKQAKDFSSDFIWNAKLILVAVLIFSFMGAIIGWSEYGDLNYALNGMFLYAVFSAVFFTLMSMSIDIGKDSSFWMLTLIIISAVIAIAITYKFGLSLGFEW